MVGSKGSEGNMHIPIEKIDTNRAIGVMFRNTIIIAERGSRYGYRL